MQPASNHLTKLHQLHFIMGLLFVYLLLLSLSKSDLHVSVFWLCCVLQIDLIEYENPFSWKLHYMVVAVVLYAHRAVQCRSCINLNFEIV